MSKFTENISRVVSEGVMMAYTSQLSPYGSRSFAGRDFVINMFEEDVREMGCWVLKHPHNETGGDLFGLWTTADHGKLEPVIHVVLGPGSGCRRTSTSFFQSIPYLKKVGYLLTQKYMLGHIGEWHSHHQLGLFEPSGGDSNTVIRNFPRGACGFILIIVNILSHKEVKISPYLYSENSRHYQSGRVQLLPGKSPFRKTSDITRAICEGAEADVEATRYGDRESAMDIDNGTWHRRSRSPKRQPVNKHLVSEEITRIDYSRQGRSARELSPDHYPSSARAPMDRQRRPDPDEFTNINSGQNRHQGSGVRERSPVVTSPSARASMGGRSPSPTRRIIKRQTDTDELITSHENRATVSPPHIEAAADGRSQLPLVSAEFAEVKTSNETQVPSSHASPDGTTHPPSGNGRSSRAGETERNTDKSTSFPSTAALSPHSPPSEATVERAGSVSCVRTKQTLPPISHNPTGFETSDVRYGRQRRATTTPATGHPSRRQSSTSETLTDVRQCTRGEKWYTTEEGQNMLKHICNDLKDQQEVKMDRHMKTEDVSIRFKCHQRKWVIEFPRDFPKSEITLTGPHFQEKVKWETPSVTALTRKILHFVRQHCPKCPTDLLPSPPKSGRSTRSSSLSRKTSGNIRAGSDGRKSKAELNPPWR